MHNRPDRVQRCVVKPRLSKHKMKTKFERALERPYLLINVAQLGCMANDKDIHQTRQKPPTLAMVPNTSGSDIHIPNEPFGMGLETEILQPGSYRDIPPVEIARRKTLCRLER